MKITLDKLIKLFFLIIKKLKKKLLFTNNFTKVESLREENVSNSRILKAAFFEEFKLYHEFLEKNYKSLNGFILFVIFFILSNFENFEIIFFNF